MVNLRVEVDFAGDGFGAADDLSAYVLQIESRIGMITPEDALAEVGRAAIRLRNTDRRFSPEYTAGPLYGLLKSGLPVRISADGVRLFTGVTANWEPESGPHAGRTCTLRCVDGLDRLKRTPLAMPPVFGAAAEALARDVLNIAHAAPAAAGTITFSGNPDDGDTVTLDGLVYTFRETLSPAQPGQVKIGTDAEASIDHLIAAINGEAGIDTHYTAATPRSEAITAAARATCRRLSADAIRLYRLGDATDSGQNRRDGAFFGGVTQAAGALADGDPAALFNGTDAYLSVPTLALDHRAFSLTAWIRPDATFSSAGDVFSATSGAFRRGALSVRVYPDGALGVLYYDDDAITGAGVVPLGSWSYLAVTFDGARTRAYLNGVKVLDAQIGGFEGSDPDLRIGAGAGGTYFRGALDEAAIYFDTLSQAQITALYESAATAPGVILKAILPGASGNGLAYSVSGTALTADGSTLSGGADQPADALIAAGGLRFDVAGDAWTRETTSAAEALRQIAGSGGGLAWIGRDGRFVWQNGDYLFKRTGAAPALTLDGTLNARGATRPPIRAALVTSTPRASTGSTGIVAQAHTVIAVPGQSGLRRYDPDDPRRIDPAGGVRTITLPFVDPVTGQPAGARDVILPLEPGLDWTASDRPDGDGIDYTYFESLHFQVILRGGEAQITVRNTALGPLYLTMLRLRGTLITRYAPVQFAAEDAGGDGLGVRRIDLPLPSDPAYGASLAAYTLARGRIGGFHVERLTAASVAPGGDDLLALEIGDVIALSEAQLGLSAAKYLIVGLAYRLGGAKATLAFTVRRLDDQTYGLLDDAVYGRFDQTLRVGV